MDSGTVDVSSTAFEPVDLTRAKAHVSAVDHGAGDRHVTCACPCHTPGLTILPVHIIQVLVAVGGAIPAVPSAEHQTPALIEHPPRLA
ncbi:MAG: hypothetical protein KAY32_09180 [Candidatus Eisenbacteria sp.]|nr:hypothetical protein [Candidatus Eisenbacteria bacterium]